MSRLTGAISPRNATELTSSQDLDDLNASSAGFYYQTANADTPNNNYPNGHAGSLIVQKSAGQATQLYQTYSHSDTRLYFRSNYNAGYGSWQRVFADNYHPNADKWTTARTISLTGHVTGSVNVDGSANASISTSIAAPADIGSNWRDVVAWSGSALVKDAAVEIHGSGYLRAAYLNMTHGVSTRNSDTVFFSSSDTYIRKNNAGGFRTSLDVYSKTEVDNLIPSTSGFLTSSSGLNGSNVTSGTVASARIAI